MSMEQLLNYKWYLLLGLEVLAWLATFLYFYARYFTESGVLQKASLFLLLITGVIPQLCLMILNMYQTKSIGFFELVVIVLVLYSLTLGKSHIHRIDTKIKNWADLKKPQDIGIALRAKLWQRLNSPGR